MAYKIKNLSKQINYKNKTYHLGWTEKSKIDEKQIKAVYIQEK